MDYVKKHGVIATITLTDTEVDNLTKKVFRETVNHYILGNAPPTKQTIDLTDMA